MFDQNVHAVVETTNLQATNWGEHLYSVRVSEDVDNGAVGYIGEPIADTNDTYEFLQPTTALMGKSLPVIINHSDWHTALGNYRQFGDENYYNEAGRDCRAYTMERNGRFTITSNGIVSLAPATGPVEGNFVELVSGDYMLHETAAEPTAALFYGKIVHVGWYNPTVHFPNTANADLSKITIQVIRNELG